MLEELRQLASSTAPIGNLNLGQVISREDWAAKYSGGVADLDFRSPRYAADPNLPESALLADLARIKGSSVSFAGA